MLLLVEEFFRPVNPTLDYAFYLGVAFGIKHLAAISWRLITGFRTYFIPYGRCSVEDFGKWAGKIVTRRIVCHASFVAQ